MSKKCISCGRPYIHSKCKGYCDVCAGIAEEHDNDPGHCLVMDAFFSLYLKKFKGGDS